jgi:DNA-binding NarL/FixJ family response regulator
MQKIRVLLIDDHNLVRQGLRRLLELSEHIEIVGEVGDGRAALEAVERERPAVAIIDISLPGLNGIEVTRQIGKSAPSTRVLILSMHADEPYVRQSLQAGARGYLLKDADEQDLIKAVTALSTGGSYFSPSVSKLLLDGYLTTSTEPDDVLGSLSGREREVLQLVAEGNSNKEIAHLLDVAVSTVESHRKRIMEKLDLHKTADMVRFAIRKGIVQ